MFMCVCIFVCVEICLVWFGLVCLFVWSSISLECKSYESTSSCVRDASLLLLLIKHLLIVSCLQLYKSNLDKNFQRLVGIRMDDCFRSLPVSFFFQPIMH